LRCDASLYFVVAVVVASTSKMKRNITNLLLLLLLPQPRNRLDSFRCCCVMRWGRGLQWPCDYHRRRHQPLRVESSRRKINSLLLLLLSAVCWTEEQWTQKGFEYQRLDGIIKEKDVSSFSSSSFREQLRVSFTHTTNSERRERRPWFRFYLIL